MALQLRKRPTFPLIGSVEDDPTRAYVKVYTDGENSKQGWEPAIASLDTGTSKEWINADYFRRFHEPSLQSMSPAQTFALLQGDLFTATRSVWVSWHSERNRISRAGWFGIVENAPFDLIIGSDLLFSQGILTFHEAALLLVPRPTTRDEEARMQATRAEQQAEIRQQLAERNEIQRDARQQRREELALRDSRRTDALTPSRASNYQYQSNQVQNSREPEYPRPSYSQNSATDYELPQYSRGSAYGNTRQTPGSPASYGSSGSRPALRETPTPIYSPRLGQPSGSTSYTSRPPAGQVAYGSQPTPLRAPDMTYDSSHFNDRSPRYPQETSTAVPATWRCSRCNNINNSAQNPQKCRACDTAHPGRNR